MVPYKFKFGRLSFRSSLGVCCHNRTFASSVYLLVSVTFSDNHTLASSLYSTSKREHFPSPFGHNNLVTLKSRPKPLRWKSRKNTKACQVDAMLVIYCERLTSKICFNKGWNARTEFSMGPTVGGRFLHHSEPKTDSKVTLGSRMNFPFGTFCHEIIVRLSNHNEIPSVQRWADRLSPTKSSSSEWSHIV